MLERQYNRPFVVGAASMFFITSLWTAIAPRQVSSSLLLVLLSTLIGFGGAVVANWVGKNSG